MENNADLWKEYRNERCVGHLELPPPWNRSDILEQMLINKYIKPDYLAVLAKVAKTNSNHNVPM